MQRGSTRGGICGGAAKPFLIMTVFHQKNCEIFYLNLCSLCGVVVEFVAALDVVVMLYTFTDKWHIISPPGKCPLQAWTPMNKECGFLWMAVMDIWFVMAAVTADLTLYMLSSDIADECRVCMTELEGSVLIPVSWQSVHR